MWGHVCHFGYRRDPIQDGTRRSFLTDRGMNHSLFSLFTSPQPAQGLHQGGQGNPDTEPTGCGAAAAAPYAPNRSRVSRHTRRERLTDQHEGLTRADSMINKHDQQEASRPGCTPTTAMHRNNKVGASTDEGPPRHRAALPWARATDKTGGRLTIRGAPKPPRSYAEACANQYLDVHDQPELERRHLREIHISPRQRRTRQTSPRHTRSARPHPKRTSRGLRAVATYEPIPARRHRFARLRVVTRRYDDGQRRTAGDRIASRDVRAGCLAANEPIQAANTLIPAR